MAGSRSPTENARAPVRWRKPRSSGVVRPAVGVCLLHAVPHVMTKEMRRPVDQVHSQGGRARVSSIALKGWGAQAKDCLRTIPAVGALVDLGPRLDAFFDRIAGPAATPPVPISKAALRRQQALAEEVSLTRITAGAIGLTTAYVTVDIDCELKDGVVYLWGATVTRGD